EELVDCAVDNLGDDFGRLSGFLRAGFLNSPFVGRHLLRNLGFVQVRGPGKSDMHREILAHLLRPLVVHEYADLRAMQIERELTLCLQTFEAADGDVLANLLHESLTLRFDFATEEIERRELLDVRWVARGDGLGE